MVIRAGEATVMIVGDKIVGIHGTLIAHGVLIGQSIVQPRSSASGGQLSVIR